MPVTDRHTPPLNADERTTLASWLDFYRATLATKCEGLDERQLRTPAVPPSPLTLQGLVQHMAEVERNWFRRVLLGEDVPAIYDSPRHAEGHDGGFDLSEDVSFHAAHTDWQREVTRARASCATRDLDQTSAFTSGEVTLRWIYTHMIAEYARHTGHADLIRERLDGRTGV
jgi:uncharacterized damage-inducible protein DinB